MISSTSETCWDIIVDVDNKDKE